MAITEKNYQGVLRGIPRDAATLEGAMELEPNLRRVLQALRHRLTSDSVELHLTGTIPPSCKTADKHPVISRQQC